MSQPQNESESESKSAPDLPEFLLGNATIIPLTIAVGTATTGIMLFFLLSLEDRAGSSGNPLEYLGIALVVVACISGAIALLNCVRELFVQLARVIIESKSS
jgi:hypothetical protein